MTLRPEDPFTCIGIGVENTYKAGGGDEDDIGSSPSATYGHAARYMAKKAVLTEGHPDDNHNIRMLRQLKAGKLVFQQQRTLWQLLVWRFVRDSWAESIVRGFHPNFPAIAVWNGEPPREGAEFGPVLSRCLRGGGR